MKHILSIILALAIGTNVYAQEISDASNLKKRKAATAEVAPEINRNIQSDQEFLDVFNWLMDTPIHQQDERRQIANASIANYIETNPAYNVELDVELLKFADTSPGLLTIFMGGYTKYVINNNKNINPVQANVAGIQSVIDYYKKNEVFLEKDKNVERFIRKAEKDKLEKYVERKTN